MDEIRFWATYRTTEQIKETMSIGIKPTTQGLLAYYQCDSGSILVDATRQYDGQFVSGAGAITYQLSGVKLGFSTAIGRQGRIDLTLPGVGNTPFTYVIESIPDPAVGRLLVNGTIIFSSNLPFSLPGNVVTFEAANVEGRSTKFSYYGTNSGGREEGSTWVTVQVDQNACMPDACGVCNGDNSTCTCLQIPYNGYDVADLERILLLYEIEQTLDVLNQVEVQLDQAMDAIGSDDSSDMEDDLTEVQDFNDMCLEKFNDHMAQFLDDLAGVEA